MGQIRQLAGQTIIYGASSVVGRVLNYLLVPLYTAVFAPAEYGVVTELYAIIAFLNVLYSYGFETAYFRFATKTKSPWRYFQIAQTSLIGSSLFFSGLLILFAGDIASLLQYPGRGNYIVWSAMILAIDAIVAVPFAKLRLEARPLVFASLKLSNIAVNIGLNLFFLLFCPWWIDAHPDSILNNIYYPELGVGYVFISNLIANALYLIYFWRSFLRIDYRLGTEWREMMRYAFPLLIMGFAGVTNEMLSRVLLKYWLPAEMYPASSNQEILGIFGACYKLSVFMTLAIQAFRYAFEPFFFSKSADKKSPQLFANIMHGFIIFGSFAWLVISLFLGDIAPIFLRRSSYLTGLDIIPWLLGGGLFLGVFYNLSVWYKLTDKTKYGAQITIVGAILTILLNFILIPLIGYMGSAITTFFSYLAMMLISYFMGRKHYPVPYRVGRGLFYLCLAGGSICAFYFCASFEINKYFISTGLVIAFVATVWFLELRGNNFKITK